MTRPSRTTVTRWDLSSLHAQANALEQAVSELAKSTSTAARAPAAAGGSGAWQGESQRACEDRTRSDHTEINKIGHDIDHAGAILRNTANALAPNRSTSLTRALGLEADNYSVGDDWQVTDARDYRSQLAGIEAGSAAEASVNAERSARQNEAANATISLQALADQMGDDERTGAAALNDALGSAFANAPEISGYSSSQAVRDAADIANGTATAAQINRFKNATHLTDAQRQALLAGNHVVIPKGQFDYLKGFYDEMDRRGLDGMRDFGAHDQSLKRALADGITTLGNPNVRTDQTVEPGTLSPTLTAGGQTPAIYRGGGLGELPASIREPLEQSAIRSKNSAEGVRPGDSRGAIPNSRRTDLPTFSKLKSVMDILEPGDPGQRLGSDVDRALIARASEIASGEHQRGPAGITGQYDHRHRVVEGLMTRMLDVAGDDHIAVRDATVTGRAEGPDVANAMPDVYDAEGNRHTYDASAAMKNLMTFDWTDDKNGNNNHGIHSLFDWMSNAEAPPGSPPGQLAESTRAGEVASEMARIMSLNKAELVDIGGTTTSLGALNPELTRTLAQAMSPYIAELAGTPGHIFPTNGVSMLENGSQFKDLFQVLDSDPTAGRIMNTMASGQAARLEEIFGNDPSATDLGRFVGRIHGGMTAGLEAQIAEDLNDRQYAAAADYEKNGALFDSAKSALAAIPGLGVAARAMMEMVTPGTKLDVVGLPPDPSSIDTPEEMLDLQRDLQVSMGPSSHYLNMLEGYVAKHGDSLLNDPEFRAIFRPETQALPEFEDTIRAGVVPDGARQARALRYLQRVFGSSDNDFLDIYGLENKDTTDAVTGQDRRWRD